MKQIGHLMAVSLSEAREAKEQAVSLDPVCGQLVEQVFVKIALLCRGFDSFYSDRNRLNAEKTQWILAFTKLGIRSKSQIEACLSRLELYTYPNPPQLGEFLSWRQSTTEIEGLPVFEEAYKISILINRQFSDYQHPCPKTQAIIRHAINSIGTKAYREMTIPSARKAFEYAYGVACKQYAAGEFKEIDKAIAEKPNAHPSDKERVDNIRKIEMEKIRNMLNIKNEDFV